MKSVEFPKPRPTRQPWGWESLLAETPAYTLKRLEYRAGHAGGLQYHLTRTESFTLHDGLGLVRYDDGTGALHEVVLHPGETVTVPAGAPHQFEAVEDCWVYEASHPIAGEDRVNVAARYGRADPPGTLPTTWSDAEIAAFEAEA